MALRFAPHINTLFMAPAILISAASILFLVAWSLFTIYDYLERNKNDK